MGKSIFAGFIILLALHSFAVADVLAVGYLSLLMGLESFLPFNASFEILVLCAVLRFLEMLFLTPGGRPHCTV